LRDADAYLGGVVAVGSKCGCGADAEVRFNSPGRFEMRDVCRPCGERQVADRHQVGRPAPARVCDGCEIPMPDDPLDAYAWRIVIYRGQIERHCPECKFWVRG